MLAFYILFPFILRALQSFSSQMLAVTVMAMYQVVIIFQRTFIRTNYETNAFIFVQLNIDVYFLLNRKMAIHQ